VKYREPAGDTFEIREYPSAGSFSLEKPLFPWRGISARTGFTFCSVSCMLIFGPMARYSDYPDKENYHGRSKFPSLIDGEKSLSSVKGIQPKGAHQEHAGV
jgi:hypothetical protein